MKTAMQQLIDELQKDSAYYTSDGSVIEDIIVGKYLKTVINQATELLELEKQQIVDAYYAGTAQFDLAASIVYPKMPQDYYNETYNSDTTPTT